MSSRLEQIRALYAELPELTCQGRCANSCGPIDMTNVERSRLADLGVTIKRFTSEDARAWAAGARLDCPALGPFKNCTVYADRPLICRLWGISESMPCPHGCRPSRVFSDAETYEFLFRAMAIGGHDGYGDVDKLRDKYGELISDPELAPLFARFIRGEQSAESEIVAALKSRTQP